jgi:hypothetical protein
LGAIFAGDFSWAEFGKMLREQDLRGEEAVSGVMGKIS